MNPVEIILNYDNDCRKYSIYDINKILIGSVSYVQFLKYITNHITNKFLNILEYNSAINIIEKYFFICDKNGKINLCSRIDSPIMANLEFVLQLHYDFNYFESNLLPNELINLDSKCIDLIDEQIKTLQYLILNHALKLIFDIASAIQNDDTRIGLKSQLMTHSFYIIEKINSYIKHSFDNKIYECKILENNIFNLEKIKKTTYSKLIEIDKVVQNQNDKINKILEYIKNADIKLLANGIDANDDCDDSDDNGDNYNNNVDIMPNNDNIVSNVIDNVISNGNINDNLIDDIKSIVSEFNDSPDYHTDSEAKDVTNTEKLHLTPR